MQYSSVINKSLRARILLMPISLLKNLGGKDTVEWQERLVLWKKMMIITLTDLCIYFSSPEDGRGRDIAHRREEEKKRERELGEAERHSLEGAGCLYSQAHIRAEAG